MEINLSERKILRSFCTRLVDSAKSFDWDKEELGKLLFLLIKELNIKKKKRLKFLRNFNIDSAILKAIVDCDEEIISVDVIISILKYNALTNEKLIHSVGEAIENDLFDITNLDHLDLLNTAVQDCFDSHEFQEFVKMICENTDTKKECGRILHFFTSNMYTTEAVRFICDIISFDFFLDLHGSIEEFLSEIKEVKEDLRLLLGSNYLTGRLNGVHGEFIDSDEDEEGNLSGFIVGEDYIDSEIDSNSEVSSEEICEHSDTNDDISDIDSVTSTISQSRHNDYNSIKKSEQSKIKTKIISNLSQEHASPFKRLKRNSNNKNLDNQISQSTITATTNTIPTNVKENCGNAINVAHDNISNNNNSSSSSYIANANKKRKSRIINDDDDDSGEEGEEVIATATAATAINTMTHTEPPHTGSLNTDNLPSSKHPKKKKKKTKILNVVNEGDDSAVVDSKCNSIGVLSNEFPNSNNMMYPESSSYSNAPGRIDDSGEINVVQTDFVAIPNKKKKKKS